jgi:molybdate transport system permease protein
MPELELGPVWLSLQLAAVTVLVLLVVGTPLAWWLAFTRSRVRTVIEAVVAMPLVLPPTVLGFYLLVLLGPAGIIGSAWLDVTDSTLTFSFAGLVVASVIYSFPFTVQPLQAAFEGVARRSKRQPRWVPGRSTGFGASPRRSPCAATCPPSS